MNYMLAGRKAENTKIVFIGLKPECKLKIGHSNKKMSEKN